MCDVISLQDLSQYVTYSLHTHTHTHTHIYMCVCVCVRVCGSECVWQWVWSGKARETSDVIKKEDNKKIKLIWIGIYCSIERSAYIFWHTHTHTHVLIYIYIYIYIYTGRQIQLPRKRRKSIEKDIDTRLTKAWTANDKLSIIWKSDLTDKMKRSFFEAAVVSILLYGCITLTLTKRLERKLGSNYTRMLRAILNKFWRNTPQNTNYTVICPPSRKLSKFDEPDTQDTAGEAETSS